MNDSAWFSSAKTWFCTMDCDVSYKNTALCVWTHSGGNKMVEILQTTYLNVFSQLRITVCWLIFQNVVLSTPADNNSHNWSSWLTHCGPATDTRITEWQNFSLVQANAYRLFSAKPIVTCICTQLKHQEQTSLTFESECKILFKESTFDLSCARFFLENMFDFIVVTASAWLYDCLSAGYVIMGIYSLRGHRFIGRKIPIIKLVSTMVADALAPCVAPHDDVIKWNNFPRYWPSVWGIHRSACLYGMIVLSLLLNL